MCKRYRYVGPEVFGVQRPLPGSHSHPLPFPRDPVPPRMSHLSLKIIARASAGGSLRRREESPKSNGTAFFYRIKDFLGHTLRVALRNRSVELLDVPQNFVVAQGPRRQRQSSTAALTKPTPSERRRSRRDRRMNAYAA
jgi:hypothetical protein